eukprot:3705087-Rhodomonas_salina.1
MSAITLFRVRYTATGRYGMSVREAAESATEALAPRFVAASYLLRTRVASLIRTRSTQLLCTRGTDLAYAPT